MMVVGNLPGINYKTYNYWYDSKRWSTDSNGTGRPGVVFKDALVIGPDYYVLDGDDVLKRSTTTQLDGAQDTVGHSMVVSTGWLTVANMAMLKRIWRVVAIVENLTSQLSTSRGLLLTIFADWGGAPIFAKFYNSTEIQGGVRTIRAHLPKQKMKAIQIRLEVSPNGTANDDPGYNFLGFGFEVGVKNRLATEPAARSK